MSYRNFYNIYALFHFDYPYACEANEGLRDEVSGLNYLFTKNGSVVLAGTEAPCEIVDASDFPKWGYRCLYFKSAANDTYFASNHANIINTLKTSNWEIEFMLKLSQSSDNLSILTFLNSAQSSLFILKCKNNIFSVNDTDVNTSIQDFSKWINVVIQNSNNQCSLFLDGKIAHTFTMPTLESLTQIKFGGFIGGIDELVFRKYPRENIIIPDGPYQGMVNLSDLGGSGSGILGNVTLSANAQINTYAKIANANKKVLFLTEITNGKFGALKTGDEVFIWVGPPLENNDELTGQYAFRTVTKNNDTTFTINSEISEFDLAQALKNNIVQLISVPNFNSLRVQSACTISPKSVASTNTGGITIFRVKNNCDIQGKIITHGFGPLRKDLLQMTHSQLIDRFIINRGGGIFIICGGKFSTSIDARLGATWDGSLGAGIGVYFKNGTNGGAGYGGGGGSDTDSYSAGGKGGVGGGGGGHDGAPGQNGEYESGDAGKDGTTGGYYYYNKAKYDVYPRGTSPGGTQGIDAGANAPRSGGGGGALGNGLGTGVTSSGACLIVIAKTLSIEPSSISTGGAGGQGTNYGNEAGGSGTGLAYLASEALA